MSRAVGFRLCYPLQSLYQIVLPIFSETSAPSRSFSSHRKSQVDEAELNSVGSSPGGRPPKLYVVQPRLRPDHLLQAKLSEALNLAKSLEEQRDAPWEEDSDEKKNLPFSIVQNPLVRSRGHADTYFGAGTVENIKCQLNAFDSEDEFDAIFVNAVLSGVQQRNLERAWGKPVLDRIGLIIEIFHAHAQTKEAKLQSELASLMYKRTRLVRVRGPHGRLTFGFLGEAEVVSGKGKGSGGRGFLSGAGESELHLQRRRIQERRDYLLNAIEEVRRTRALQRYARKRHGGAEGQGLPTVAVVGYTNTGKSTLVSALTHSELYRDDRLFATVDPRLRSVILPSGRKVLLSDTVGFISDLPVQLIEAFHATLEEVVDADLLVHVIDSCAKNLEDQRLAVTEVLKQIGVSEEKIQNMIEVWNKIDLVRDESEGVISLEKEFESYNVEEHCRLDGDHVHFNETSKESNDQFFEGDEPAQFLTEYLEDDRENIRSHKLNSSLRDGSHSGILEDDSNIANEDNDEDADEVAGHVSMPNSARVNASSIGFSLEGPKRMSNQCALLREKTSSSPKLSHVKISAIKGIGLQELLHVIDEKLGATESFPHKVTNFDRKWRPSSTQEQNIK